MQEEERSDKGKEKADDQSQTSKKSEDQSQISKKARSILILCLGDKALREVGKEPTALSMWKKLEDLYNSKSLANRLYVK